MHPYLVIAIYGALVLIGGFFGYKKRKYSFSYNGIY